MKKKGNAFNVCDKNLVMTATHSPSIRVINAIDKVKLVHVRLDIYCLMSKPLKFFLNLNMF